MAPGWFPAAEEEGSSLSPSSPPLHPCQCPRSAPSSHPKSSRVRPPGLAPDPSPQFSARGTCVLVDSSGFSSQPLERSPGSWHYLSAQWPPHSSKLRALAALQGLWPAAETPSCRALTSMDDDSVAQPSIATLSCRGNTVMVLLAGSCLLPVLPCLGFPGPELHPRASHPELSGLCSVPGQGCGEGDDVFNTTSPEQLLGAAARQEMESFSPGGQIQTLLSSAGTKVYNLCHGVTEAPGERQPSPLP